MSAITLHYRVDGSRDAPTLLLLGSLGTDGSVWEPLIPALSRRFCVIRPDTRGHGESPAPPGPYTIELLGQDVLALLDQLEVERASVCGTSLGGMIAMWLGVHAKPRVERLALLCTSPRLPPAEAWRERAALVRSRGPRAIAETVVSRWFTPRFAVQQPSVIASMAELVESTSTEGYAACCEAIADWDISARLSEIEVPTLVIAGADDLATPPAHAYAIGAAIAGSRVHVLESAAHLALLERPLLVTRLLLEHFERGTGVSEAERTRRAVLGDLHVDRSQSRATPFTAPFQDLITRYAWGEVWTRPGLSRAERSIAALSVLVALRQDDELAMHILAALRNGLTVEQIQEVLLQSAVYAGVPAANHAFAIAQRTLQDAGAIPGPKPGRE